MFSFWRVPKCLVSGGPNFERNIEGFPMENF